MQNDVPEESKVSEEDAEEGLQREVEVMLSRRLPRVAPSELMCEEGAAVKHEIVEDDQVVNTPGWRACGRCRRPRSTR